MKTRQNYLNGECTHEQYYNQFVTDGSKGIVLSFLKPEEIKEALELNENLNTIPLTKWDMMGKFLQQAGTGISDKMKKAGDGLTLSGLVCILKESARQIAKK